MLATLSRDSFAFSKASLKAFSAAGVGSNPEKLEAEETIFPSFKITTLMLWVHMSIPAVITLIPPAKLHSRVQHLHERFYSCLQLPHIFASVLRVQVVYWHVHAV